MKSNIDFRMYLSEMFHCFTASPYRLSGFVFNHIYCDLLAILLVCFNYAFSFIILSLLFPNNLLSSILVIRFIVKILHDLIWQFKRLLKRLFCFIWKIGHWFSIRKLKTAGCLILIYYLKKLIFSLPVSFYYLLFFFTSSIFLLCQLSITCGLQRFLFILSHHLFFRINLIILFFYLFWSLYLWYISRWITWNAITFTKFFKGHIKNR